MIRFLLPGFFTLAIWVYPLGSFAWGAETAQEMIPRVVLAFYDSQVDDDIATTLIHQSAEMPLNHLGLKVRYHDIHDPLPQKALLDDVRGILLWLTIDKLPDPAHFLHWLIEQMQAGRRVIVMGRHSFEQSLENEVVDPDLIKAFWNTLGLEKTGEWRRVTYDVRTHHQSGDMVEFERDYSGSLPSFPIVNILPGKSKSYMTATQVGQQEKLADIVAVGSAGGYVAPGYAKVFLSGGTKEYWYLNPFRFFRLAFATNSLPIPDTTTVSGRRIFYSHIDGNGWQNQTQVPEYREVRMLSAEVVLREVLLKYPELPATVSPIAGDLDLDWFGSVNSLRLAREIFELPNIEAGSHTYTHPKLWKFFQHYEQGSEAFFREKYQKPNKPLRVNGRFQDPLPRADKEKEWTAESTPGSQSKFESDLQSEVVRNYGTPRLYYNGPYDLKQDIQGSIAWIQKFLPEGKQVKLLQWSGDMLPFAEALRATKFAGVHNLNGGHTRFDGEFDSIRWISPIGRSVEGEQQIYASMSNENTYTDFWTRRYYGFGFLTETLKRTETPVRLKPINIYYQMHSGERISSLNALRKNYDYVSSRAIAPISASEFAAIGESFYAIEFETMGERRWRVHHRKKLQTIRFDRATFDGVDFSRSDGVMGQTHLHGSLYIALDPEHAAPVIALKTLSASDQEPEATRPYLINGRWHTQGFEQFDHGFRFRVKGYGTGNMAWYMPNAGSYRIQIKHSDGTVRDWVTEVHEDHWLDIRLSKAPVNYSTVTVELDKNNNAGA